MSEPAGEGRAGRSGGALCLLIMLLAVTGAGAAVLQVPSQYATIQAALDAAQDGDWVQVAAGTYVEQLDIHAAVTLKGVSRNGTHVQAPTSLVERFTAEGVGYRPVIYAHAPGEVTIRDLTVDGAGYGAANPHFAGVAFHSTGGTLLNTAITGIKENPLGAADNGTALIAWNGDGASRTLTVSGNTIRSYQKCGLRLGGAGLSAVVSSNEITGPSRTGTAAAPDGIQVGVGVLAALRDNEIYDNAASGAGTGPDPRTQNQSAGIRLVDADPGTVVEDNVIVENDTGITAIGASTLGANFLLDNRYAGIVLRGGSHVVDGSNIQGIHRTGLWVIGETDRDLVEVDNVCLSGPGGDAIDLDIAGIRAYSAGTELTVDVRHCTIVQWNVGLRPEGSSVALSLHESSLGSNNIAAYDNTACGRAQDATLNWWGVSSGPAPVGLGDPILGDGVLFEPRRIDGQDTNILCGLQGRGSTVGPVAPSECISVEHTCAEGIPVDISRTTSEEMRGFTITFALGGPIQLCDGLNSIHEGTYLNGLSGGWTHFEKHAAGGGVYVVDCALLGEPCGQTAASGTLFTMDLARNGGDGTGTITVTGVTLRDCDNHPIDSSPGPAAEITVDTAPPTAVADVSATQVKAGNDTDGTTRIQVSFTAPGDASVIEVYRAPYGCYPEYDDDLCVAPDAPTAYPPAAPWVLTPVSGSGQYDEPETRGYWYYVVFTADDCDNWSAVSNRTTGTLNYHLGDVTNGGGGGMGDNDVDSQDISRLGATYWLGDGQTGYDNTCDVGPTADYSVNTLPTTDSVIGFEDLMVFAMNYMLVGLAGTSPIVSAGSPSEWPVLQLQVDEPIDGTRTAHLMLTGNASATKGLHAVVAYDPGALALQQVTPGELLEQNGHPFFIHRDSGGAITLDAAAIGLGTTLSGSGEIASLRFQILDGSAVPVLDATDLRGVLNQSLQAATDVTGGEQATAPAARDPWRTELLGIRPNPFTGSTEVHFSLAAPQAVTVRIFDASGRLVRTLLEGIQPAGEHHLVWDGRTGEGVGASSGVYLCTFHAGGVARAQKVFRYR